MNNRSIVIWITMALVGTTGVAQAQQHASLLKQAIGEVAKGNCPELLMSPMLRGSCQTLMPNMGHLLAAKGPIDNAEFMGMQSSPMGPAEVYKVTFGAGIMMWMINTGADGKILVFWSPSS